jgi:hypothetical protein
MQNRTNDIDTNEFAIDLSNIDIDSKLLFKILSYINVNSFHNNVKIILFNLSDSKIDEFCQVIKDLIISPSDSKQIWNDQSALILISCNLRYQIICGKTREELLYLNQQSNLHYPNKKFEFYEKSTVETIVENPTNSKNLAEFVLPYELLIEVNNQLLFEQYILKILQQPIEDEDIGYRVSHNYTRIGNKLIIKNFYEADSIFQSSFFAERFAYMVSQEIIKSNCLGIQQKKGVLIGYNPYSELLVKSLKYILNLYYKKTVLSIIITANEEESSNIKWKGIEYDIISNPNEYAFITIVPLGSTLTTCNKIIALFKRHINIERKNANRTEKIDLSYNFIY